MFHFYSQPHRPAWYFGWKLYETLHAILNCLVRLAKSHNFKHFLHFIKPTLKAVISTCVNMTNKDDWSLTEDIWVWKLFPDPVFSLYCWNTRGSLFFTICSRDFLLITERLIMEIRNHIQLWCVIAKGKKQTGDQKNRGMKVRMHTIMMWTLLFWYLYPELCRLS